MFRILTIFLILFVSWSWAYATNSMQNSADRILNELYETIGNYQIVKPQLEIVATEEKIASYSYRRNLILIEQKAIEVCKSFGSDSLNALAFIIGHELAHAYKGNGENRHTSFLAYDRHFPISIRDEKLADIQGAFNAYLAGYDPSEILPKLIDNLYERYNLKDKQLYGYPALEKRKQTSNEVKNVVDTLIQVFESANYLTALGYYQIASEYYKYILQYYMGKELLNNLGVLYIHRAMQIAGKNVDPYLLPIELDFQSRLNRTRAEELTYKEKRKRKQFLEKAMAYFDKVLHYETTYFPAYLNKLCILLLDEHYEKAIDFYASENFQKASNSNEEKAKSKMAIAIVFAFLENDKSAQILKELSRNSDQQISQLASDNLSILNKNPISSQTPVHCKLNYSSDGETRVDGVTPYQYIRKQGVYLDRDQKAGFYSERLPNSNVLVANWEGQPIILQRINSPEFEAKGGLKTGLSSKVLFERLQGNNFSIIPAQKGYFVYCNPCQLIFKINERDLIVEWGKVF